MAIDFPSTSGQATDGSFTHTSSGVTWAWDGTTWKAEGVTSSYTLPTAAANTKGGIKIGSGLTMTNETLSADASAITVQEEGSSLSTAATTLNFVGPNVTASGTGAVKTITISDTKEPEITWTLGLSGNDYTFTGSGFTGAVADPTLYLIRGQTYKFDNQTGGHPFRIQSTVAQAGGGTQYNSGVTNNDAGNGTTLTFVVPMDAPDILYYQCTAHPAMTGTINISGGGGLQARKTTAVTTSSIANAASDNITFASIGKSYGLLKIQVDKAAWVVLYTSQAARTADSARLETTDPLPGSGVIAEILSTGAVVQGITPGTIGWNDEATPTTDVYAKVTNKSGSTGTVAVTLTTVQLEA